MRWRCATARSPTTTAASSRRSTRPTSACSRRTSATCRRAAGTYPSPLRLDAVVFDTGKLHFDGAADFLAKPQAAIRGDFSLAALPLGPLTPIARQYAVQMTGGKLSVDGKLESTAKASKVDLRRSRSTASRPISSRKAPRASAASGSRRRRRTARPSRRRPPRSSCSWSSSGSPTASSASSTARPIPATGCSSRSST